MHKEKYFIIKNISRAVHLFSMAYIVGQSFSIFTLGAQDAFKAFGSANYNMEMIMLILVLISGITNIIVKLKDSSAANLGRKRWLWIQFAKFVILVFLTPISDLIALSWSGGSGQTQLNNTQLYAVRSIKFVLILAAFLLGSYARIFREDITNNFSREHRPNEKI
jgi:hypothetical protein